MARVGAPVVAGEPHLLEPEHVEQGDRVVGQSLLAEVVVGRLARPAEAAQVRAQQAELARQLLDHEPPRPPVLRPAVQRQDGRRVRRAGAGEMDPDASRQIVEAMLDAFELRHGGGHVATRYG